MPYRDGTGPYGQGPMTGRRGMMQGGPLPGLPGRQPMMGGGGQPSIIDMLMQMISAPPTGAIPPEAAGAVGPVGGAMGGPVAGGLPGTQPQLLDSAQYGPQIQAILKALIQGGFAGGGGR